MYCVDVGRYPTSCVTILSLHTYLNLPVYHQCTSDFGPVFVNTLLTAIYQKQTLGLIPCTPETLNLQPSPPPPPQIIAKCPNRSEYISRYFRYSDACYDEKVSNNNTSIYNQIII